MSLTPEQIEDAKRFRALKPPMNWADIIAITGCSLYQIKCAIVPGFREECREQVRQRRSVCSDTMRLPRRERKRKQRISTITGHSAASVTVPQYVLAERERYADVTHSSLTACLLGDPLPGRSALDQRQGA